MYPVVDEGFEKQKQKKKKTWFFINTKIPLKLNHVSMVNNTMEILNSFALFEIIYVGDCMINFEVFIVMVQGALLASPVVFPVIFYNEWPGQSALTQQRGCVRITG